MLNIITEVSDGPKESYFYPNGCLKLQLIARVADLLEAYVYAHPLRAVASLKDAEAGKMSGHVCTADDRCSR